MYRLHCFAQSGNCFKVAFLLRALNQPYESVFVDYMHGRTREDAWRAHTNPMGEAPVLEDGARTLSQSGAILTFLAEKHAAFGGRTEDEKVEILRWLLFDNHKFTSYFGSYRFAKAFGATAPDPAIMAWLRGRMDTAFGIVDKHLSSHPYIVGVAPTIADFSLSGYLYYPVEESAYDWPTRFPHIAAWTQGLRALPGWAPPYDVLPGERIAPRW